MRKDFLFRTPLLAVILIPLLVLEYGEAFTFYFVGDDFGFIHTLLRDKWKLLWMSRAYYHYYPLGITINALPALFGSFEPRWYVLINFAFFLSCSLLVAKVCRDIAGRALEGALAALLFATAVPNSEVIYWKTGNQTIAMTFFSVLAVAFFTRYLINNSRWAFAACVAAYALSMLCIEQGVVTFGVLLLYDVLFHLIPRLRNGSTERGVVARFARRQGILLAAPILLTAWKLALGLEMSPAPLAVRDWRGMGAAAVKTIMQLIDYNEIFVDSGAPSSRYAMIFAIAVCVLAGHLYYTRSRAGLFFLGASLGSLLVIFIGTGSPNPRYFCLPLAFYACFLALFMGDVVAGTVGMLRALLQRTGFSVSGHMAGWLSHAILVAVSLAVVFVGLSGNLARRDYWKAASTIERNVVESVERYVVTGQFRRDRKVFLLDAPDAIWSPRYSTFYVGSNSLGQDLGLRLGKNIERVSLVSSAAVLEMSVRGERVYYRTLGRERMLEREDIDRLVSSGHLVLRFLPSLMTVRPLG
jgi:hypothetical protein